jgi:circadian clock protein KaiC
MTVSAPVPIVQLPTGVPGLDEVLGGGIPEYSLNLIAGAPGTGKTTLASQIVFANASAGRPAVYFTVLGEPPLKMLRYQQQFAFFATDKVNRGVHFVSLSQHVLEHDLSHVLDTIMGEVQDRNASMVVVDSIRTVRAAPGRDHAEAELQGFLQQLAIQLASWQATTFLVGEYPSVENTTNPIFTTADGIFLLRQSVQRDANTRTLQVVKMRGQGSLPGLHSLRLSSEGVRVFPRFPRSAPVVRLPVERLTVGVPELDDLLGGGIPEGDVVLVVGPSGTGKSVLATHFIAEGGHRDEPGVAALFEERPDVFVARAEALGLEMRQLIHANLVEPLDLRSLDLSVDEVLHSIQDAARRLGARRVVIDSLSGLRMALETRSRATFRETLYRLVEPLTAAGLTVLIAAGDSTLSEQVAYLADDIIDLRHVEQQGRTGKILAIVKMRSSSHSSDLLPYEITDTGILLHGILHEGRGAPTELARRQNQAPPF